MSGSTNIYTFVANNTQKCEIMTGGISGLSLLLSRKRKYVVIIDEKVYELWKQQIEDIFHNNPRCLEMITIAEGESSKQVGEFLRIMQILQTLSLNRRDALVMIGGGACCDVGGLAAACFMRGIPHFLVPTTLLAMIDATIGGKVGINLPGGKNLLGGFHTPEVVWIDLDFLKTLPLRQKRQALAEVVKMALISDIPDFFYNLESFSKLGDNAFENEEKLTSIIEFSIIKKLRLVEPDWKEKDLDRLLNAGHAVAHSLETVYNFDHSVLGHGEAVALGLAAKTRFSKAKGFINPEDASRVIELIKSLGLSTSINLTRQQYKDALAAIHIQKRIRNGNLRLVLPNSICSSLIYHGRDAVKVMNYLQDE